MHQFLSFVKRECQGESMGNGQCLSRGKTYAKGGEILGKEVKCEWVGVFTRTLSRQIVLCEMRRDYFSNSNKMQISNQLSSKPPH